MLGEPTQTQHQGEQRPGDSRRRRGAQHDADVGVHGHRFFRSCSWHKRAYQAPHPASGRPTDSEPPAFGCAAALRLQVRRSPRRLALRTSCAARARGRGRRALLVLPRRAAARACSACGLAIRPCGWFFTHSRPCVVRLVKTGTLEDDPNGMKDPYQGSRAGGALPGPLVVETMFDLVRLVARFAPVLVDRHALAFAVPL